MGYKCPNCNKDFGLDREKLEQHFMDNPKCGAEAAVIRHILPISLGIEKPKRRYGSRKFEYEEPYSDEAHNFVNYVWDKYIDPPKPTKTTFELVLDFIDERIKWNEEMKKKDPKPSDIGRIEEAKCIRRYVEAIIEKQRCKGCNNVKGCITCTDGDQWAHIEEIDVDEVTEAMEESVENEPVLSFFCTGQPTIGAYSKDSLRNQFEAGMEYERNRKNKKQ